MSLPGVILGLEVSASGDEPLHDARAAEDRRHHKRCIPATKRLSDRTERGSCTRPSALPEGSAGAEVGAGGDQPLEHFRMAVFRRQEERSVPTPGSIHFTSALPR